MSVEQDKAFVRTFVGIIIGLTALAIGLIILASTAGLLPSAEQELEAAQRERAEERLQPPAAVRMSGEPMPAAFQQQEAQAPAAASGEPMSGEQVVAKTCHVCHGAAGMGAPVIGNKADWQPRAAQGFDTLVNHAIHGIRGMPARGGNASLSDEEIRAAVAHMLEKSGLPAK